MLLYFSAAAFLAATEALGFFKVAKVVLRLLSLILSTALIGPSTLSCLGSRPNLDKVCVENLDWPCWIFSSKDMLGYFFLL